MKNREFLQLLYGKLKTGALSAMISGDPYFHVHPYDDEKELLAEVRTILTEEK